jgi:hypothetical protein
MKIIEGHSLKPMTHFGYQPFAGVNPRITRVGWDEAEYVWYSCVGDGDTVRQDLKELVALGKPIISVTLGDDDYSACLSEDDMRRNFCCATKDWKRCVPCVYDAKRILNSQERPLLANFCGSFRTYGPREMLAALASDSVVVERHEWWDNMPESERAIHHERYVDLLLKSKFSLCPRGAGPSSMRLYDSVLHHSLPITIDDDVRPFNSGMDFALKTSFANLAATLDSARAMLDSEYARRMEMMERFANEFLLRDDLAGCSGTLGYTEYIRLVVEEQKVPFDFYLKNDSAPVWGKIPGFFDFGDLYKEWASRFRDGDVIVEIGSYLGRSAVFLADAIRREGKKIDLVCIDVWPAEYTRWDGTNIQGRFMFDDFMGNVRAADLQFIIEPFRGTSLQMSKEIDNGLAAVFIDADHSYESVRDDIAAWLPKVRPGGVLAGHDFNDPAWPGVTQAVRERFGDGVKTQGRCWIYDVP